MAIDWEELRKKAQKKIDEERGSTSVQEVLPRVNQTNKEQITVNLTPNNKVLEIATKRQKEYQEELEKQKAERKQREQEAYDNTQKLKKEYQESQKWLMQHSDQNNTIIGKTTQEYIDKSNEMLSQGEAYAKAMEAYEKEYSEEYKNRMKESNAKSMAEFPETVKEMGKDVASGIVKHSEAFDDGYQFGDISKSVGSTVADMGINLGQGITGVTDGAANLIAGGVAEVADAIGYKDYAEQVRSNIANPELHIFSNALQKAENTVDKNSWQGDTLDQMIEGVGQSSSYLVASGAPVIGQALSAATMFASAAGNELAELYSSEDYQNGDLRKSKIWAKAIGSGMIEMASEKALGYFGPEGGIDKKAADYLSNLASTSIGKIFARQGVNAFSEGVEEFLSYGGNYLLDSAIDWVDKQTGGTGEALRKPWNWADVWQQAYTAMGSTILMGGVETAVKAKSVKGNSMYNTLNNTATKMDLEAQMENLQVKEQNLKNGLGKNISTDAINSIFTELQNIQNQKVNVQTQLEVLPTANGKKSINENETLPTEEQKNTIHTIENSSGTLYNQTEDGGLNNGYKENIDGTRSGLYEEREHKETKKYNWDEYNKWEQSIKPIGEEKLTENERKSILKAKTEFNKNIILYDENSNDSTYSGGASKEIGKITISKQKAEKFGLDNMLYHEIVESDILHNDKARDILEPVIEMIQNDINFETQKEKFWENQNDNIPSDLLIAKDILCDKFSEIIMKETSEYENTLTDKTNLTINLALENYCRQVYGKDIKKLSEEYISNINSNIKLIQESESKSGSFNLSTLNTNNTQTELFSMLKNKDSQQYQYIISNNTKVNAFNESASKYFNNSEESKGYLSALSKIIKDKDIEIKFDGNLKTPDGKVARGSYSNGVITINPYSNSVGEFVAIHEITHAIGTQNMIKMLDKFKNSNVEFNNEMKALLENYSATEINEEALADVSAQLFGTQEFINNVAEAQPSLFQKIYSEIKYLWHQFRGYKNQNQFINDLYFKWTQAYNSNNKLNNTTNYYIETVANYDEMEYNNAKEIKLSRREYAILSGIINSDSNIKPGINEVETTNAQYTVYFKETGEFKILDKIINEREDINVLRRTLSRDETTRSERFDKQVDSKKISDQRTRTYDDGILEVDSPRTYKRSGSNYNGETNSRNNVKYSIQESENNSGSFNLTKKDNKGRTLSQEQQEYFKNSKVRDENGNLKTVYHGTDAKFTEFNYEYLGKNGTANGKGFYFADDINIAKSYSDGKNLVEAYVNIEKPLSIGKTTMSENDYIKFVKEVNDKTKGVLFADFGDGEKIVKNSKQYNEIIEQFREEYKYNGDDVDLVLSVLNSANMKLEDGYRLLKRVTGYDGIIVEADYKNNGETIPYTQYIPLTSEQIKNVDNTTPTNNPDIRYSTTNSNSWQKYLEKNFTTKGTRTNLQDILVQKADNKVNESKSEINNSSNNKLSKADEVQTAPKAKKHVDKVPSTSNKGKETEYSTSSNADKQHSITTKDSRYISRNSNKFINKLVENLQISKYSNKQTLRETVQEIREEVLNNGKLTNEKRKEIFDKMYSNLVVEDKLYYEEYKEVLRDINNTRFIIPDSVKADIPDFSEWSKKNLNNLVPKKGISSINIDSKYKELSEAYPNLFDVDIINPTEQLLRIVEVKNDISKARVNLQAYNDKNLGSEYKLWAEKDFNTLIDTLEQDILNAKRYRDEKNKQLEEKKLLNKEIKTIEEIKDVFALKKSYQKEYNKVLNKEVLTKEDLNLVQNLLDNKITVNEISKNPNKKGILNVYNAKKPIYETDKVIKNYQKKVKESRYNEMENLIQNIDEWKDKKTFGGFRFGRETAQRNIRDVVGDNETAARINKELFDRYSKNETSAIKEKNELVQRIKDIGFDTSKKYEYKNVKVDEATLAQLYVEKKVTDIDLRGYGVDVDKIKRGAKEYQNILDNLINRMSDELVKNGYAPVEYRKDYFPHFTESKPDTAISKIASLVGIDMTNQDLPTDIAGITETFKPGKTWMGNLLQRTGNKTDYNAYKALDKYISGAMDIIYHTSDIQRLRAFENTVRNNYASENLKEAVENVKDNDILTEQEKEEQIEIIYNREKTQLSNFVTWLREYTDIVANKKSSGDRAWEKGLGRNIYNTMNNIEGKIASNMIGGNLSVSLTNLAPLTQASATTSYGDLVIGMIQTGKSYIKNDGFDSDFLTRRKGAERLSKTFNESISDISGKAMQFIDDFVSESIVRAKYRENLNNGMDAITAIENADTYTAEIMADRSKGALPTIFNKKNPVAKLVNMFQVEVNNTVSNYTKDMSRNSAGVVQLVKAYTRLAIGSTVFNEFMKSIRGGGDVLPDPISWIKNLILWAIGDDDEKEKAKDDLLDGLVGSVPFVQSTAGLLGMEDVGRVPISSAMPDLTKIFGLSGTDEKYKKQVLTKELTKPLLYLGLPTGGAQIKKTVEGLSTIINGGSYKYNKEGEKYLQYAVEDKSAKKVIQSSIFGKWSISEAKEYVNDGMKALNAKETKVYDNSIIPFKEFKKYTNQTFTKKSEKTSFINQMELDETQKWDMYTGFIFSHSIREKDNSSQLEDAIYATQNGIDKNEYIKAYNNALLNDVNMPEKEDLKDITENNVNINNYISFKINTKGMDKSKDKIKELKSANYSEEDKKFIYQKINSQDSNFELLMDIGIKIDDYLDYKMQEFESDKKDDGTLNGKTVQNSRKKKILNYINKSNLSYEQRLLLYGMNLSLTSNEKSKVFNYINSSNLSKSDRLELLNKVKGFTVYKSGKVVWK